VRASAAVAVSALFGKRFDFKAQGTPQERAPVVKAMRDTWHKHNNVIDDSGS
jgi:hypothetical protein